VQNEELFPFIKQNSIVLPEPKNQICFSLRNAIGFIEILARVRPDFGAKIAALDVYLLITASSAKINWFRCVKESLTGSPLATVLIRKSDLSMGQFSSKTKSLDRMKSISQYIDPLDRDML
jgi:hypothetical protein